MIALLTPTADQPTGFALCESYMQQQTLWGQAPLHWIVVDDGLVSVTPTLQQTYIRRSREADCSPAQSLCRNLLRGLEAVPDAADYLFIIEHDDWYHPTHLQRTLNLLQGGPIAGDPQQRYYNIERRQWRIYPNRGSCLCQTGLRREAIPVLKRVVADNLRRNHYGIDGMLWGEFTHDQWCLGQLSTVVGMKGLPGRPGIGVGHRPGAGWKNDPAGAKLHEWIGADAYRYLTLK